jgi:parallel beta-helix repeat protein
MRAAVTVAAIVVAVAAASIVSRLEAVPAAVDATPVAPPSRSAVIDAAGHASLQAALDAVPAGGGMVRLPPGEFVLTAPLVLSRRDTRIVGSGTATHLINRNEAGLPALIVRPADRKANRRSRIWRVQLANFRVSGNPKSGDGIQMQGINELLIHAVSVDHNGGHGISLVDCYEDPRVCNSLITYNGGAGLSIVAGHDIVVSANQFEENTDAVRCVDSFNLCMTGNNLDDHLRHGVVIENTYGSVLSGNMIEECRGTAVVLDRDCYGNTISANVIAHNGAGVDLRDAWGCAVSANTFTMVAARALVVGPGSGRITITGNNFSNAHIGGKTKRDDPASGVLLRGASDVTVCGNVFTGLTGRAIEADANSRRIAASGNVVSETPREGDRSRPMNLGGAKETVVGLNVTEQPSTNKGEE